MIRLEPAIRVFDHPRRTVRVLARTSWAILMAVLIVAVTHALIPFTGGRPFFFAAFPIVMVASLAAGAAAGITATLLATAAYALLYFDPVLSLVVTARPDSVRLAGFAASALLVAAVCGALRSAYRRERVLRASADASASALRERTEHLGLALRSGRMLAWTLDLPTGTATFTGDAASVYGRTPPRSPAEGLALVHPEDAGRHRDGFARIVREGGSYESEFRVSRGDTGETVWVHEHAICVPDHTGRPWRIHAVATDVTRRKLAELALEDEARRKDRFLAMLGHELRNPLAPMRNAIAILQREDAPAAPRARSVAVLGRQLEHLTRLVDDLLDVSRIVSGKIRLERAPLDLREVVRKVVEDHRTVFASRGVALRLVEAAAPPWIDGDETRIAQLVGNLLQNAAKFTDAGGAVTVAVERSGASAEIRVRDDGIGIHPDVLPALFQPFAQADVAVGRSRGGLGLGLSLVKGIAELHGGSVRAASGGLGCGSEFVVTLPAVDRAPAAHATATEPSATERRCLRVLVVDDNADAALTLADLVTLQGHAAEVAHDGRSAIAMAQAAPPDVVVCDIGLPDMSGYDVARALRAGPDGGAIRLVALTGYAQPKDRESAATAGFDEHVAKPVDPDRIARLLDGAARSPTPRRSAVENVSADDGGGRLTPAAPHPPRPASGTPSP
ncbi:MAG TPA: ATP-binding protein [Anaeromyxobacter sp.]|nr:ATP-binding protein [Anaeromyxobacter sp.]